MSWTRGENGSSKQATTMRILAQVDKRFRASCLNYIFIHQQFKDRCALKHLSTYGKHRDNWPDQPTIRTMLAR